MLCVRRLQKKSITACVLVWDGEEAVQERKKEFGKTRRELEKLRFWLMASKVSVVATESAPGLLEAERQKKSDEAG